MIEARRAAVRPRVFSAHSGETLLLEDEVRQRLESGARGNVAVVGPPGAGKTTALAHLAAVLPAGHGVTKANLCGADLRGARLDGVDFYLVDLRGARCDPAQEKLLRAAVAILETPV